MQALYRVHLIIDILNHVSCRETRMLCPLSTRERLEASDHWQHIGDSNKRAFTTCMRNKLNYSNITTHIVTLSLACSLSTAMSNLVAPGIHFLVTLFKKMFNANDDRNCKNKTLMLLSAVQVLYSVKLMTMFCSYRSMSRKGT